MSHAEVRDAGVYCQLDALRGGFYVVLDNADCIVLSGDEVLNCIELFSCGTGAGYDVDYPVNFRVCFCQRLEDVGFCCVVAVYVICVEADVLLVSCLCAESCKDHYQCHQNDCQFLHRFILLSFIPFAGKSKQSK